MPTTSAQIVETSDGLLPFKVVFCKEGEAIAERAVTSELAARELIANCLPILRKHDDG
jgi:hypothetical protein